METLEDEIPNVDLSDAENIRPYQFEPLANTSETPRSATPDNDRSNVEDVQDRQVNTNWCKCGISISMGTQQECICCQEIAAISAEVEAGGHQCITESPILTDNCLNRHVLQVSMYEYLQNVGPIDDNQPSHQVYRHLAYRRFVRWIWHFLGKTNRKILPACVVSKIREAFPSEQYCGFRYAR